MSKIVPALDLLLPGDPLALTGGYIYDRRILQGLEELGWRTAVHSLDESFPVPTPAALERARATLASLPAGRTVLIDGLALAGLLPVLADEACRLSLAALIHHPLALETGLEPRRAESLREAERAALEHARRVIVTSRWTAAALAGYGVPGRRIRVVEPGIDPQPAARGSGSATLQLLCVGALTPRKGHATLFDALARIKDRSWTLCCVGSLTRDPGTVESLRRQLLRSGLDARVALAGEVAPEALSAHYDRADLFVLASHLEGYGMAFAEALARGLPIVGTLAGAVSQTVPAAAGRLVRPGDSRALAAALAALMDDAVLRARLASGALGARERLPTWEQAASAFAAALEELG